MTVAILIPVMRAHKINALHRNIATTTPLPHAVYWAATEKSDCAETLSLLGEPFLVDQGDTWGHRLNALYRLTAKLTHESYLFLGADDVAFHPGWLEAALETMKRVDGVVAVNDLHNPRGTLALVSRAYIEELGGTVDGTGPLIHTGYAHLFSETELFETAQSRGRFAYCRESIVEHLHPAAGKGHNDAVYDLGNAHLAQDEALYRSRRPLWAK